MKHGDFTELAKYYVDRPGYSLDVLKIIKNNVMWESGKQEITVADVGAGTGKLTENLFLLGLYGYAVEPNDAMLAEGIRLSAGSENFQWLKGTAEMTGLPDRCVEWVLMGSSFHWTDVPKAMEEFYRILKPGGFFTAIWNPRNIKSSQLHMDIEEIIYDEVPDMKRVSSGLTVTTEEMTEKMCSSGMFGSIVYVEAPHSEVMSKERYLNIWRSVNDIRVQAGEDGFRRIMEKIEGRITGMEEIIVPYCSRSWTVRAKV